MKRFVPIAFVAAVLTAIVVGVAAGWSGGAVSSSPEHPTPTPTLPAAPTPPPSAPAPTPSTIAPAPVTKPTPPPSKPALTSPSVNPQDPKDLSHLAPKLRGALVKAIAAAQADGITLQINSGWRSAAYQEQLWQEAIRQYGSPEKAHMWVLPPDESDHVKGTAVDIGPWAGAAWMQKHGARFGLCPKYANEHWHFEYRTKPGGVCPAQLPHP